MKWMLSVDRWTIKYLLPVSLTVIQSTLTALLFVVKVAV
jgi:hypothetical protein